MLPTFEKKKYEYEINGKIVKYQPWKTKDEKEFLIFQQSTENSSFDKLYEIMVEPLIEVSENLTYGEKQMVLIEIRKKSYGESVEFKFTCGKCKSYNDVKVNISDIVKYTKADFSPLIKDGYTLTLKSPLLVNTDGMETIDKDFTNFVAHIDSVTFDNTTHKDFTITEISNFIDDMPSNMFDYFYKEYTKNVETITYFAEGTCINCKVKQSLNISKIPNFFPW